MVERTDAPIDFGGRWHNIGVRSNERERGRLLLFEFYIGIAQRVTGVLLCFTNHVQRTEMGYGLPGALLGQGLTDD